MRSRPHDLIDSKLYPAIHDPRTIMRTGFVGSALADLPGSRLIGIVAPAGAGKSTLMAELKNAFSESDLATTWLGLDSEDNDPATFALYFISALQSIEPSFAQNELTALSANPIRDFDALFDRLAGRLAALHRPAAVFLDDFQHLSDPRILRFFERLLTHLPANFSLAIASRHRLALPLARLRVAGKAIEAGQTDLYFNHAQTQQFLARFHQLELSDAEIDALVQSTEGWPAGIQLAALALRRHEGETADLIKTFSGRDHDLTQYLVESVIQAQPEPVVDFLLRSSALRRLNADLCVAATGLAQSGELLEYVRDANLFLIALDRQGWWYRYHHLFGEFLRDRLRREDPDAYRSICSRAAKWCETHDRPTEAIRYALDAEHFNEAADLIARHAIDASLFRGDHYTVQDWMRVLPAEFRARRPELLLSHAWSCAFSRETDRAMQLSQQAIDTLSSPGTDRWDLTPEERERWLLWARNVQAATKACSDDIEDCIARATDLVAKVPTDEPFLIATLSNCLSYGCFALRDFEHSREHALAAHEHGHRADAAYLSAWGDFLHGLVDVELGELSAASSVGKYVHRDSKHLGLGQQSYVAGLSALLETEIAVQRCDFGKASERIDSGRAFRDIFGPVEPQLVAQRNEARLLASQGRLEAGLHILRDGQDAALREHYRRLYLALAIEEASLQLAFGHVDAAAATTRRAKLLERDSSHGRLSRAQRAALKLLEARFRLAQGDARLAARLLTTLQQSRGAESRGGFFLSVTAHRAVALWQLDQRGEAARKLNRALTLAAPEFHAYPLISVGEPLLPILEVIHEYRADAPADDLKPLLTLQNWLVSYLRGDEPGPGTTDAADPPDVAELIEPLTVREIELLRLLQAGLSNQTLSEALLLSVSTVKWHLHNIYTKLQVSSRGAAVAVATKLGLI